MIPHSNSPIRLEGICKSFGAVRANHDISLTLEAGKIMALLGENGAGKSTLMSILSGKLAPDAGTIYVDGKASFFRSPKDAYAAGVGMVYQHFMLIESMTVAQNVLLGQEPSWLVHPQRSQQRVRELAKQYGLDVNPAAKVHDLSMGEKQRVEILKLLQRNCRVLIFDEPTAVLTPQEVEQLFDALRHMARSGKAIVFISHKLQEVRTIADSIAILRRGAIVDSFAAADVPDNRVLANRMVGRDIILSVTAEAQEIGEAVLTVKGLSGKEIKNIDLTLHKGEIVAIGGVAGNGQKELVEVLCGLRAPEKGTVTILSRTWKRFFALPPRWNDLAYIPEDRLQLATCKDLNLVDNFLLTARTFFTEKGLMRRNKAQDAVAKIIRDYDVQPPNSEALAGSLSGGNLQKLVIGRELFRFPAVIVAENPTQGLDIAATEDVWKRLLSARKQAGILLVTGDLTEALELADRIAVMVDGRFIDCFSTSNEAKVAGIGLMMAGVGTAAEA